MAGNDAIPFVMGEFIARGAQGSVNVAKRTDTGETIAVKSVYLDLKEPHRQEQVRLMDANLVFILTLKHRNLVMHIANQNVPAEALNDLPAYLILMELCAGKPLDQAAKFRLSASRVQKWTTEILLGLQYLHENRVIHRDIKCDNILLTSDDLENLACSRSPTSANVKQLAHSFTRPNEVSHEKGTWAFMSPEMITGNISADTILGRKTDIWSLGCVVIQMLTGNLPQFVKRDPNGGNIPLLNDISVMFHVGNGGRPEIPMELQKEIHEFIDRCLIRGPVDRPTATQLLDDPFIKSDQSRFWAFPDTRLEAAGPSAPA